jgi:hypothetical protein
MPGQFINSGNNPNGKISLVNNSNSGNLSMSPPVGFTIYSSDFTTVATGSGATGNNISFTISGAGITTGDSWYEINLGVTSGGNLVKSLEIYNYYLSHGLNINNTAYMFYVTYGAGSTVSSGVIAATYYNYNDNDTALRIGTVDTSIPGWDTPGAGVGDILALTGTFYLPISFTLYSPLIADVSSWYT